MNQFDVIFLNGPWISLGRFMKKTKLVINIFAGFDLEPSADYGQKGLLTDSFKNSGSRLKKLIPSFFISSLFKRFIHNQRQGIKRAQVVNYYTTGINPHADKILQDIKAGQYFKRLELRGFDCNKFPYKPVRNGKEKFVVLNITRFFYLTKRNDNKRNDIMIRGIGRFIKNSQPTTGSFEILFFEKGPDIADAKRLCGEYGLDPFIKWQKEVSVEELNDYFEYCDVAFDQLGDQWLGAGLFSMLTGRPLIANGRPEIYESITGEKSPVCQAKTEEEVEKWLTMLYNKRNLVKEVGINSRNYVLKHYDINQSVNFFVECFDDPMLLQ